MFQAKVTISPGFIERLDLLKNLKQDDIIMRTVATTLLATVHDRIHEKGLNSAGEPIGNYSKGYMKVRTGNFVNSSRVTRGKNKGKVKDAGNFTRGEHKGEARPRYNRTGDTKVVASLTRQMENDFKVIATDQGYGLGYSNPDNLKKAGYVEATYDEKIFDLTEGEQELAFNIASTELAKILNQ